MSTPTISEENYLKAIYKLSGNDQPVSTNVLARELGTSAASASDMLRRLSEKGYLVYKRYYGARMTEKGARLARSIIRKHRLWETFLVEKLQFGWEQVHEVAEQLEHVQHPLLIQRLDAYLGYPRYDPHGAPIPDAQGLDAPTEKGAPGHAGPTEDDADGRPTD
ncbi:MAG: metal-dependent transcriptional regulator [Sphingobacteriia bacterium]